MTVAQLLSQIDQLNPNDMSNAQKTAWILTLEKQLADEVLDTHQLSAQEEAQRQRIHALQSLSAEDVLLAPDQYAEVYRRYVDAQIAMVACDTDAYENAQALHNNALLTYKNYFNRTHRGKAGGRVLL